MQGKYFTSQLLKGEVGGGGGLIIIYDGKLCTCT